jgi:hypothetical protein
MEGTKVHAVSNQDQHFDNLLKSVRVPERSPGYWENFPQRVTAQLSAGRQPAAPVSVNSPGLWAWGLAGASAVLIAGYGLWMKSSIATAQPNYTKLYHEIESMFPNQVRAIVVEQSGVKLDLSERPDVPSSPPVRVDVCRRQQCLTYITFSGQSIHLNGESCDVLADGQGHILLVGRDIVWTSGDPSRRPEAYHIEAGPLGAPS